MTFMSSVAKEMEPFLFRDRACSPKREVAQGYAKVYILPSSPAETIPGRIKVLAKAGAKEGKHEKGIRLWS